SALPTASGNSNYECFARRRRRERGGRGRGRGRGGGEGGRGTPQSILANERESPRGGRLGQTECSSSRKNWLVRGGEGGVQMVHAGWTGECARRGERGERGGERERERSKPIVSRRDASSRMRKTRSAVSVYPAVANP